MPRQPTTRLQASTGWASLRLDELWEYRELLYFLVWRDLRVRYKQTILGAGWAILQPLVAMVVFSVFFGRLAGVPSDGVPYPIFSYVALVPWIFFAGGVSQGANALVSNPEMVRKVYFPRITMPAAAVLGGLVDFFIAFVVLLAMMLAYRVTPTPNIVWLPLFLLLAVVTTLGVSFWLSAMNVQFRDVRYAVPFLVQIWLFVTPVAYSSGLLAEPWRTLYGLNPMAGVVEGFRWTLLDTATAPGAMTCVSAVVALASLVGGIFYFRHMERTFADVI